MSYEILTALIAFSFVSSITPGPNNLMLMASGVNYGFKRTIPHMLGVGLGFTFMIVLVGLGLLEIFNSFPILHDILSVVSVVYMVWLAWKIAKAGAPEKSDAGSKPMTFLQAALFQWVNPKAWVMALTATTLYAPSQNVSSILLVALVFGIVNLPCVSSWTVIGMQVRKILTNPRRLTAFNLTMAALLLASLAPVLMGV